MRVSTRGCLTVVEGFPGHLRGLTCRHVGPHACAHRWQGISDTCAQTRAHAMPGGSYMARGATAQVGTSGTRCAPLPTTTPRSCDIACNPPAPVGPFSYPRQPTKNMGA